MPHVTGEKALTTLALVFRPLLADQLWVCHPNRFYDGKELDIESREKARIKHLVMFMVCSGEIYASVNAFAKELMVRRTQVARPKYPQAWAEYQETPAYRNRPKIEAHYDASGNLIGICYQPKGVAASKVGILLPPQEQ